MNNPEDKTEQANPISAPEYVFDISKQEKIIHRWTDRGAKLTCENAGHPYHEAWKLKK